MTRGAFAAALAGAIVMAEVVARRALRAYGRYYRYVPHRRQRIALNREALPALRPVARIEINRDGERGGEPPRAGERALRALVVGGSAAECIFLDQDQTWAAVAERILNERDRLRALGVTRAHVGSVARAIVPCAEIDQMLRKILPRYRRLDLVLVMVGASDLVSWLEKGMPATLRAHRAPLDKLFERHPEGPWGWSPRRSALFRIGRDLHRRLARPVEERADGGAWLIRARRMRAVAPNIVDEQPDASAMLDRFEHDLVTLLRTASRAAARVILVRQPWLGADLSGCEAQMMWNFGLGRPYREEVTSYLSPRVVDALMRRVDARAAAAAQAAGVEQVDLTPYLERSARTFYDYLHFTPEGAEVVGRVVAEVIVGGSIRAHAHEEQPTASTRAARSFDLQPSAAHRDSSRTKSRS